MSKPRIEVHMYNKIYGESLMHWVLPITRPDKRRDRRNEAMLWSDDAYNTFSLAKRAYGCISTSIIFLSSSIK